MDTTLNPPIPAAIGPYTVVRRLGEGGMGTVYLCRTAGGGDAAVKLIRPGLSADPGFRRRFAAEVDAARRVASFCTAAVLGHGVHEDQPYLATEYIDGPTLNEHVARTGPLPPGTLHSLAVGVAAALTAVHAAGLIHRDVKPQNVILSITGPRVIDFGISRAVDGPALTARGVVLGTPGWLAPEQLHGADPDPACDVFAWGCLVAWAGLGRHPYGTGDLLAVGNRMLHAEPDLDGLPAGLADVVRSALSTDPARRPTARDLLLTLTGGDATPASLAAATRLDPAGFVPAGFVPPQEPPKKPPQDPAQDPVPTWAAAPGWRDARSWPVRRLLTGAAAFAIGLALLVLGILLLPR
jgi:serine/threonine protein kinase